MTVAVISAVILWLAASCALLALAYRRTLLAAWREPVLRAPVLIFESDDWGYGPVLQAERLDRIAELLAGFRDAFGRHPVVTLGVVLAGPDTERMRADEWRIYHRVALGDARLAPVRQAIVRGAARGVFALQLHGMEHFWPACLMQCAASGEPIRQWLSSATFPLTEELPAPLQSRWIDSTDLPSKGLPVDELIAAAGEEMRGFAALFGSLPEVVVPATFVWNDPAEAAWARAGARVVVTPGLRNEARDAQGRVVAGPRRYFNAASGPLGVSYVVRDCYFEPSLGHTHDRTLRDLRAKTRAGRPTLVEMHRLNFVADERATQQALEELARLLEAARSTFPGLLFMSTAELARHYREGSSLVDRSTGTRVHFLLRRLAAVSRLRKLAWASGAALVALPTYAITRPRKFA